MKIEEISVSAATSVQFRYSNLFSVSTTRKTGNTSVGGFSRGSPQQGTPNIKLNIKHKE